MLKDFTKRQQEVFGIIVTRYIETAEPVGSRFVARRLDLSSATIRNVMADLEEAGFITQPHTSAGRIPTDRGYRYYIDFIMRTKRVGEDIIRLVDEQYHHTVRSLEDTLERTTHLISNLTNYVGITLYPQYEKVYLDGACHILEQPEFRDIKKLYGLLKYLEEKRSILGLLSDDFENDDLTVHIGRELKMNNLNDCSIVTRGYKVKGRSSGRIGVIGPKRMLYDKVIPTIEILSNALTAALERWEI